MSAFTRHVLIVDDNDGNRLLLGHAIQDADLPAHLHEVADGEQALAYLRRATPFEAAPRPDLIILDLNLPGMHGHQVLKAIKARPDLTSIPVVVFSSSEAPDDVMEAYRSHATTYVSKPVDLNGFEDVVDRIRPYWSDPSDVLPPVI